MLDELRTLIALAETGSLQRAAARVFRTPSAATRQIQRLEKQLGIRLLDRSLRPARLTPAGRLALQPGRELMRVVDQLQAFGSGRAEPSGPFRLGVAHALADPALVAPALGAIRGFRNVEPRLSSDTTSGLFARLKSLDLDAALVLLPVGAPIPAGMGGAVLGTESYRVVRARRPRGNRKPARAVFEQPWIVNPPGCLVRGAVERGLEAGGLPLRIAAEMHDVALQMALIGSGAGPGVVPGRVLKQAGWRSKLEPVRTPGWDLTVAIGLVHPQHSGILAPVAEAMAVRLRAALR